MKVFRMSCLRLAGVLCFFLGFGIESALANCVVHFQRSWSDSQIIAYSLGPDCARAVLVLTVRDKSGYAIWTSTHRTADLMTFQNMPKLTAKSMAGKLENWVAPDKRMTNSSDLPDWPQSASEGTLPPGAEFPFRVSESLDRRDYLALRKARLPILCLVTGMESQTCLIVDKNTVTEVGTQSFPG
jgi:hypothetical protein